MVERGVFMDVVKWPNSIRYAISIIGFWAMSTLGPFLFSFFNAITPYRMEPGSLLYLIFTVSLQPGSFMLACYIADHVAPNYKQQIVLYNAGFACAFMLWLLISAYFRGNELIYLLSHVLSIVSLIYFPIELVKKHAKEKEAA